MLAIRQHEFGDPEQLRLEEVADPHPGEGELRIRVAAAGVHLIDTAVRRGASAGPLGTAELPMTPGREVAGIVDEVGRGVDEALLGLTVAANLGARSGGYAQLALADADQVRVVPPQLDAAAAVTMVGTGRTAMAIFDLADPSPDDVAVIAAAAGGIGSLLTQLLVTRGATVVGLAGGPAKLSTVERLGATAAVDSSDPLWAEAVRAKLENRSVTLGLEGVGGRVGRGVLELLSVDGRLVMYGSASGSLTPLDTSDLYQRGITAAAAIGARLLQRPERLPQLESRALAAANGRLVPVIQEFALSRAADAHRALEQRANVGKVVLRV